MLLSILIATLEKRKEKFDILHKHILKQIEDNNLQKEVEILVFSDNKEYPVGMKRNALLGASTGLFTCFVDDDDWVSDDYVISICNALKQNPDIDCVGIKGILISKDLGNKEFIHSLKYGNYFEDEKYYYRPPNHLNPIKRSISTKIRFPLLNFGEDTDWAMNLCKSNLLVKEVFIDKILYHYYFEYAKSETIGG